MIRHQVAVRFRSDTAAGERAAVFAALEGLRDHLNGILDVQFRDNISPEDRVVHGFRHLFWFDFADAAARDAYLVDPTHKQVGAQLVTLAEGGPDGIQVIDFEV